MTYTYTESTLQLWTAPLSRTESERVTNTIAMIKSAISSSNDLKNLDIEVFAQGSYANNTNVRQNSDVDICVMCKSTVFADYAAGLTGKDYNLSKSDITFSEYKVLVLEAIENKFGTSNVTVGNKSIKIASNTYHIQADVVPAFMLMNYAIISSKTPGRYVEGIRFISKDSTAVSNYPKDHIANGIEKNKKTNHAYKNLVRIMKHIRNNMVDDKIIDGSVITSFLVECLVWNVPDYVITGNDTWNETIKAAIAVLSVKIGKGEHKEWGEVSERLYLFNNSRKWTAKDAKDFLDRAWIYLGY